MCVFKRKKSDMEMAGRIPDNLLLKLALGIVDSSLPGFDIIDLVVRGRIQIIPFCVNEYGRLPRPHSIILSYKHRMVLTHHTVNNPIYTYIYIHV